MTSSTGMNAKGCSAHKAVCCYPDCPATCTGRAENWNGSRSELLEEAATSEGLHRDAAVISPEDRDWLEDQGLIRRDYNRYRATDRGLKALFPSMRVL